MGTPAIIASVVNMLHSTLGTSLLRPHQPVHSPAALPIPCGEAQLNLPTPANPQPPLLTCVCAWLHQRHQLSNQATLHHLTHNTLTQPGPQAEVDLQVSQCSLLHNCIVAGK